jgi:lipooligosaccharide transport system ATP-binding protein
VTAVLDVSQLSKTYRLRTGGELRAVDGVSFQIRAGECFGLLGPNGAGKSTTIQCVTGFYPLSAGQVRIGEWDVHQKPKQARQSLGVCSQEDTLDTDFTVLDQLERYARFFRIPAKLARERARSLLARFELLEKSGEPVETLSGGMKRRLQVARALICEPALLILDEPTTGLDPDVRRMLWEVLSEARAKGTAILLSTHYMDEAERLCDRIGIMSKGKILDIDSPRGLISRYINRDVVEEEIRPGVIWKRPPNLEDVYLKLTGSRLGVAGL